LKVITITVPPLRERDGDVAELAHHLLFQFNRELGMNVEGFDPETLSCLQMYRWPGNVRELQSVIKEAMLRSTGSLLLPEFLPPCLRRNPNSDGVPQETEWNEFDLINTIDGLLKHGEKDIYAKVMRVVEQILFSRVLQETQGHQGQASDRLGLNRSTLRYKMRDLGLNIDQLIGENMTLKKSQPGSGSSREMGQTAPKEQLSGEGS
jgi:two-component system nitrogen regulation response regulator GlnG